MNNKIPKKATVYYSKIDQWEFIALRMGTDFGVLLGIAAFHPLYSYYLKISLLYTKKRYTNYFPGMSIFIVSVLFHK